MPVCLSVCLYLTYLEVDTLGRGRGRLGNQKKQARQDTCTRPATFSDGKSTTLHLSNCQLRAQEQGKRHDGMSFRVRNPGPSTSACGPELETASLGCTMPAGVSVIRLVPSLPVVHHLRIRTSAIPTARAATSPPTPTAVSVPPPALCVLDVDVDVRSIFSQQPMAPCLPLQSLLSASNRRPASRQLRWRTQRDATESCLPLSALQSGPAR